MSLTADELLRTLAEDVRRLLAAGARAAVTDENLRRDAGMLRRLAEKVPTLARLAGMVERLLTADAQAGPALLELLLALRQVSPLLAAGGVEGPLVPLQGSGPWQTPLSVAVVLAVAEGLTRRGHWSDFDKATAPGLPADLRLLAPLLDGVGHRNEELVKRVTEQALPAFGAALAEQVRERWDPKGKKADIRLLNLACRLDTVVGGALCLRALRDGNVAMRERALQNLPTVLPSEQTLPILIDALAAAASKLRNVVTSALARFGDKAIPALLTALDSPDARRRAGAATTLGLLGCLAWEAVPHLLKALADDRPTVRQESARALGRIGPAAEAAIPHLCRLTSTDGDDAVRGNAITALQALGADPAVGVPAIVAALEDVAGDRTGAAFSGMCALSALGPEAAPAVPLLCRFMDSDVGWMRTNAALTLAAIGAAAGPAVPLLIRELRDSSATNRELAARALGQLGPIARAALPALKTVLTSWEVRRTAAFALVRIAGPKAPARSMVVRFLRDAMQEIGPTRTVSEPVEALRRLDPSGRTAIDTLLNVLGDPETRDHEPVVAQLLRLNPPRETILPVILPLLRKTPWVVARAVRWFGPEPWVLATLIEGLEKAASAADDGRFFYWSWPVKALGEFGPVAKEAIPVLTRIARRPGSERLVAAVALARITGNYPALAVVVPALHPGSGEREEAARALRQLGPAGAAALPALLELLNDSSWGVRQSAIQSLGRMGAAAHVAVPALRAALHDESGWMRPAAVRALLRLGAEVRAALGALPEDFWDKKGGSSWAAAEYVRQDREELADSPEVMRTLEEALHDEDGPTRLRAALTLVRLEKANPTAIRILAEAASTDPDDGLIPLRLQAAELLLELGPAVQDVQPMLKAALGRVRHWDLRRLLHRAVARPGYSPA